MGQAVVTAVDHMAVLCMGSHVAAEVRLVAEQLGTEVAFEPFEL